MSSVPLQATPTAPLGGNPRDDLLVFGRLVGQCVFLVAERVSQMLFVESCPFSVRDLTNHGIHGTGDHIRPKLCLKQITGSYRVEHVLKIRPRAALRKNSRDVF